MARARVMKIDNPAALGRRVAAARSERGLSLRQLSFEGCTGAYISTIENGKRVPSLQVLQALADRLDVSVEYLATGETAPIDLQLSDAELAVYLGDHESAAASLGALVSRLQGRRLARALALRGLIDVEKGSIDEGVTLLEQSRELSAAEFLSVPTAVEALGRTYATQGQYELAIELFTSGRDAAVKSGDRPRALKNTVLLANAYIDLGDLSHSADALAEALRDATFGLRLDCTQSKGGRTLRHPSPSAHSRRCVRMRTSARWVLLTRCLRISNSSEISLHMLSSCWNLRHR
jgi:transcriptional regulator with XRE-family HTH domain